MVCLKWRSLLCLRVACLIGAGLFSQWSRAEVATPPTQGSRASGVRELPASLQSAHETSRVLAQALPMKVPAQSVSSESQSHTGRVASTAFDGVMQQGDSGWGRSWTHCVPTSTSGRSN